MLLSHHHVPQVDEVSPGSNKETTLFGLLLLLRLFIVLSLLLFIFLGFDLKIRR